MVVAALSAAFFAGVALVSLAVWILWRKSLSIRPSNGRTSITDSNAPLQGESVKMVLVVRNDLGMQKGKIAAQCGHAVLGAYKAAVRQCTPYLAVWEDSGQKKITLKVQSEEQLMEFGSRALKQGIPHYLVRDAGHTQVAPHTLTVCALGPAPDDVLDELGCSGLKLL